jgi:hypothetical protein
MQNKSNFEALTYVEDSPDIPALRNAYDQTVNELEAYFDLCRTSYDDRRNWWPGKSRDHRKHGADAFPWEGASDTESHVIDERITRLVSLFVSSLNRSNIRAYPVESNDVARAELVSSFLKWMVTSGYIPRYKREMELGANYLLERGLLITYVGWHSEDRQFLQKLTLQQIAELDPNIFGAVQSGENDDELVFMLQNIEQRKHSRIYASSGKQSFLQFVVRLTHQRLRHWHQTEISSSLLMLQIRSVHLTAFGKLFIRLKN